MKYDRQCDCGGSPLDLSIRRWIIRLLFGRLYVKVYDVTPELCAAVIAIEDHTGLEISLIATQNREYDS